MRKFAFLVLILLGFGAAAQDMEAIIKGEKAAFVAKRDFKSKRSGQAYDITYHHIKLTIDPAVRFIAGSVYSELIASEDNFTSFAFDLDVALQVDSVLYQNAPINFIHQNDEVSLIIEAKNKGEMIAVEIFYRGDPSKHKQNGFSFDMQHGGPIAWTLSEPYGAYGWWPCKQQLVDKIDSLDCSITIPKGNKAASLGLLQSVDTLVDSSLVFHWKHRYPTATYLVAVAVTNYIEISHYIPLSDGDSLYHLDYIYPNYQEDADTLRLAINGMMRGFDSLFGPYPFRKEKYGHAMFGRGGGMEHQTMSFMSSLDFDLMAHELAHQWFGNKITCGSWEDLWLNESWATYSNAIAREMLKPREEHLAFLVESISRATRNNGGAVFAYDTVNVGNLFNGDTRYRKGSMVLHQLRWVMGDSAFFAGTRNYMADAALCYGFAKTIDFREAMENASGMDLTGFFDRYIYKEGYPNINARWNRNAGTQIKLKIGQTTSHESVSFFPVKIEYKLVGENQDSIVLIDHNNAEQELLLDVGFKVTSVVFDPNVWLLAKGVVLEGDHVDLSSVSLYPNPSENTISVYVKDYKLDKIEVLDLQGRVLLESEVLEQKNVVSSFYIKSLANGMYLMRVTSGNESVVLKFVKLGF